MLSPRMGIAAHKAQQLSGVVSNKAGHCRAQGTTAQRCCLLQGWALPPAWTVACRVRGVLQRKKERTTHAITLYA
eukprot:scaffold17803_cov13-Tisochrysis_lutea.AAC.2